MLNDRLVVLNVRPKWIRWISWNSNSNWHFVGKLIPSRVIHVVTVVNKMNFGSPIIIFSPFYIISMPKYIAFLKWWIMMIFANLVSSLKIIDQPPVYHKLLKLTDSQWTKSKECSIGNTGSDEWGRTRSEVETRTKPWFSGNANTPGSGWFELTTGFLYIAWKLFDTKICMFRKYIWILY